MFDEIKKKYPKSWEKWNEYMSRYTTMWEINLLENLSGSLFRFFDKQEIYIEIIITTNSKKFFYEINRKANLPYEKFNSRTEAEESAFTKAFGILEEAK